MVNDMPGFPPWEASRLCTICDDEVHDEHFVVSHLLTPLTLAVCNECFSWRGTWDDLADEFFDDHVDRWQALLRRDFGNGSIPGI